MKGGGGHRSQINVTPLVDVVLVLLIIFMVIVPIAGRGYDVDVPVQAGPSEKPTGNDLEQVVLEITVADCPLTDLLPEAGLPPGCRVRIGDRKVDFVELATVTEEIFGARTGFEPVLFLAAEDDLEYEPVMRIVDAARSRVPELRIGLVQDTIVPPSATAHAVTSKVVKGD